MKQHRYWLCVISGQNLDVLKKHALAFYAVGGHDRRAGERVSTGDSMVLYTTTDKAMGTAQKPGLVGLFTVTREPYQDSTRIFRGFRSFPTRIAWKPEVILLDEPAEMKPLVPLLEFIKNKQNYGMFLRTNLRELSANDFKVFQQAIRKKAKTAIPPVGQSSS